MSPPSSPASPSPSTPSSATCNDSPAGSSPTGLDAAELFPAEPLGGLRTLRAPAAPLPRMRFVPTGGIDAYRMASAGPGPVSTAPQGAPRQALQAVRSRAGSGSDGPPAPRPARSVSRPDPRSTSRPAPTAP